VTFNEPPQSLPGQLCEIETLTLEESCSGADIYFLSALKNQSGTSIRESIINCHDSLDPKV
jgi:hypothetical protein